MCVALPVWLSFGWALAINLFKLVFELLCFTVSFLESNARRLLLAHAVLPIICMINLSGCQDSDYNDDADVSNNL